jgi:ubiquinone/menaquinone biosynthesis C-methylase UbiE
MKINLICPVCHGQLIELACSSCNASYSLKNGVPSFICREMYPSDEAFADAIQIMDFWGNGWEKRLAEPDHKHLFETDRGGLIKLVEEDVEFHRNTDSVMPEDLKAALNNKVALNIGCGAGSEALMLVYGGAKCIAMDITAPAAGAAEYLMHTIGGDGIGIQADSRFIPLESSSVDVVYSSGVLHHSPDIEKSIAEVFRVLKPGGRAFIMLYATWSVLFIQQRLMLSMGEGAWETGGRKNPHTTTFSKNECRKMFSQFCNVKISKTGENLKHLAIIGKYMPSSVDRFLYPYFGPRLNIVAEKPNL